MLQLEKWQKDLDVYCNVNTTFIIEGNVHDKQPYIYEDGGGEPVELSLYLHRYLFHKGYDPIVFYNRIDGFYNMYNHDMKKNFMELNGKKENDSTPICVAADLIRNSMANKDRPIAIVIDLANTISSIPDQLEDNMVENYTKLMLASKTANQAQSMNGSGALTNLLFFIVNKANDIPAWFYLNNPYVRTLSILKPQKQVREFVIDGQITAVKGIETLTESERKRVVEEFVTLTDGMTLVEIFGVFTLVHQEGYSVRQIREAIKRFRFGETQSHWDKLDFEKVKNAKKHLESRVKGQDRAIEKTSGILRRACLGLTGMQGGANSRPKGVLFLAGPTGTGKTELAKTIAEFVFGDESFVTRFDMSEYQQPHSDQKLLGAPPGYVGYAEGGQLTNAIKSKPFCVLLFDEIDKAHPSILDKFLQILEDGRITDSSGETVYFSEALIIFTSNLGVVSRDPVSGIVKPTINLKMSYDELEENLMTAIKDYFKFTIQRPELLNRIGNNFIVFDFIRENTVEEILNLKIEVTRRNLEKEKGVILQIEDGYKNYILQKCLSDLSNGGRGISNMVETYIINPLPEVFIREDVVSGQTIVIHNKNDDLEVPFDYSIRH